ncbi:hypothetical protein PRIPAC_76443 [Pristionchus pacificus]|uniref:Uncharacterized protein n=1 Tax=Pristionchus pacificus TaxID=54126 RepID=A0A2A6CAE2_PRIPA|nr:hypothetical protein PRIPAC_76443 [Pristionchus pacificus]|eukprot:PDM75109.1 hypothetical protein PRIPAC_40490 [Pristionchus pacificus]
MIHQRSLRGEGGGENGRERTPGEAGITSLSDAVVRKGTQGNRHQPSLPDAGEAAGVELQYPMREGEEWRREAGFNPEPKKWKGGEGVMCINKNEEWYSTTAPSLFSFITMD